MSLKIHSVVNGNIPQEEFVWLHTDVALNLKSFAVVDRTFDPAGKVSNEFRHIFVFPDLQIAKDDWVKLCTGIGTYTKQKIKDKPGSMHFLFWGAKECVWNNKGGDVASLITYTLVNSAPVAALK